MDELYIKRVLAGDTEAFRYFVRQYKETAFHLAVAILKDEFKARDAVQESFILAYRKLSTFRGKARFSTWFTRIVINESLKLNKLSEKERIMQGECEIGERASINKALFSLDQDEQRYYINLAMKEVSSREALALNLFYLQEQSLEEISNLTGWTSSNVKVILHRARKSMYVALDRFLKQEKNQLY